MRIRTTHAPSAGTRRGRAIPCIHDQRCRVREGRRRAYPKVAEALGAIGDGSEVDSVIGPIDLIAMTCVGNHDAAAALAGDGITEVPGVQETETHNPFSACTQPNSQYALSLGRD